MGLAITGLTASEIYQSVVKYDIDIASGGSAQNKGDSTMPYRRGNNIGTAGEVDSNSMFGEGGHVSRLANQIPGVNAVSGMHDVFQIRLGEWGSSFARNAFNVPGMLPAAAITYAGIINLNPAFPASIVDQIRR